MGRIASEQENNKNYLKCILGEEETIDEDCLAAISDEQAADGSQGIAGIIPVIYSQIFTERVLRYDVNAFLPFAEYKTHITKGQITKIFLSIMDICRQAEAYLLDVSYFLLEEQYIFVDRETGNAHLILYPVSPSTEHGDFRRLFTQMMQGIRLPNADMNFYGAVTYELNQAESFSIVKFRELLLSTQENQAGPAKNSGEEGIRKHGESESGIKEGLNRPDISTVQKPERERDGGLPALKAEERPGNRTKQMPKPENEKKGFFGKVFSPKPSQKPKKPEEKGKKQTKSQKTFILDLPDGEVVLPEKVPKTPVPEKKPSPISVSKPSFCKEGIPMTDDEDVMDYGSTADEMEGEPYIVLHYINETKYITVKSFPFEIGREGKGYRIDFSKTKVSRKHVEIISTPNGFKVCDCSKLGTFLNGTQLPKGNYVPLADGAKLSLKGEEFVVSIYEG